MADRAVLAGISRALVVGTGRSGRAAATALVAAGVDVRVVDEADAPAGAAAMADLPVDLRTGTDPAAHLDDVDLVVPSPGVPERATVLRRAAEAGVPVWSEPELGWRLAPRRLVAVTGTNGKTSVTELVTAVLRAGGIDAVACGNIGTPLTEAAAAAGPDAVLVAELSSFQLRFCHRLRPEVGVLLNIAPDHLDWHGDLAAYGAAKARMWRAQRPGDRAVHNDEDPVARTLADDHAPADRAAFAAGSVPATGVGVDGDVLVSTLAGAPVPVLAVGDLPLTAPHHVANVAAAATVGLLLGVAPDDVARAATAFRPGRHRLEPVAEVDGVTFVDDSKATNAHAAAAALASFDRVVWIAGGLAKGVDLSLLGDHLATVRAAVVIGEAAEALTAVCRARGVPVTAAASMEEAVRRAAEVARAGDTVLLAPACASFDMFADYADRGDRFAAAARALAPRSPEGTA